MSALESQAKNDVVICHDIKEVQAMFKQSNLMKGIEVEEKPKAEAAEKPKERIFHVPNHIFDDFSEINDDNIDEFEYLAAELVMSWLEKCLKISEEKPEWQTAIGFPDCVPSLGRSHLHELANFFNLAHHTTSKRGAKNRRMLIYPKTMFVEMQQKERERLIDERKKIREKYAAKTWIPEPAEHPVTFRDQVIRELWEERKGITTGQTKITSNMIGGLDEGQIGQAPDAAELQKLVEKKKAEMAKLKDTMDKRVQLAKERLEKM